MLSSFYHKILSYYVCISNESTLLILFYALNHIVNTEPIIVHIGKDKNQQEIYLLCFPTAERQGGAIEINRTHFHIINNAHKEKTTINIMCVRMD